MKWKNLGKGVVTGSLNVRVALSHVNARYFVTAYLHVNRVLSLMFIMQKNVVEIEPEPVTPEVKYCAMEVP